MLLTPNSKTKKIVKKSEIGGLHVPRGRYNRCANCQPKRSAANISWLQNLKKITFRRENFIVHCARQRHIVSIIVERDRNETLPIADGHDSLPESAMTQTGVSQCRRTGHQQRQRSSCCCCCRRLTRWTVVCSDVDEWWRRLQEPRQLSPTAWWTAWPA